jgi:hypothetical protein
MKGAKMTIDPNNLTTEQIQEYARIQSESAYFSEKFFTVNNEPYSLEKFPYAKAIYEDESEFIILFLARSLTKSTIATNKITHKLATQAGKSAIATAPTDGQAWRLTKEIFRPNLTDSQHHALGKLVEASEGSDQVGEIDLANGSKWTAKGAWATGKAIRGPHRYYGIADEMQDMTRTPWYVLLEVVNLPGRQIIAMGTGGHRRVRSGMNSGRSQIRKNGMAGNGRPQTKILLPVTAAIIYHRHGVHSRPRHH